VYAITIRRAARKALTTLPADDYARVLAAIQALAHDPRPPGCVKLTGSVQWRIRVGVYRVVYEIDDAAQTVTIDVIGHRRDVYR
jgi:mRNA interferase RelE/StbE